MHECSLYVNIYVYLNLNHRASITYKDIESTLFSSNDFLICIYFLQVYTLYLKNHLCI